jgi:hypothetical protein
MVLKGHQMHAEKLLTEDERAGLSLSLDSERTHCLRCQNVPWFTNGGFNNIGTGQFTGEQLDFGRVYGLRSALMDGLIVWTATVMRDPSSVPSSNFEQR